VIKGWLTGYIELEPNSTLWPINCHHSCVMQLKTYKAIVKAGCSPRDDRETNMSFIVCLIANVIISINMGQQFAQEDNETLGKD